MFIILDDKMALLDLNWSLPKYRSKSLEEQLLLDWMYHSNALEGNRLMIKENKVVLEGIIVGGKTMGEYLEFINHRDAISYVEEIVRKEETL